MMMMVCDESSSLFRSHSLDCRWEWSRSIFRLVGKRAWWSLALCIQSSTRTWSHCPQSTSPEEGGYLCIPAHWGLGIQQLQNKSESSWVNHVEEAA